MHSTLCCADRRGETVWISSYSLVVRLTLLVHAARMIFPVDVHQEKGNSCSLPVPALHPMLAQPIWCRTKSKTWHNPFILCGHCRITLAIQLCTNPFLTVHPVCISSCICSFTRCMFKEQSSSKTLSCNSGDKWVDKKSVFKSQERYKPSTQTVLWQGQKQPFFGKESNG